MEILSNNPCQEPFILKLLFVEIINHKQYLNDILLYNFCLEGRDLSSHLCLQKLHQNRKHILILIAICRKFDHYLSSQDYCAFAQPVLYVRLYFLIIITILCIQSIVAEIYQTSYFILTEEMIY